VLPVVLMLEAITQAAEADAQPPNFPIDGRAERGQNVKSAIRFAPGIILSGCRTAKITRPAQPSTASGFAAPDPALSGTN